MPACLAKLAIFAILGVLIWGRGTTFLTGHKMLLLRLIAVALFAWISVPFLARAVAEPLDKEACLNLQLERKRLLTPKMQSALEQGPDWVKNHLNDEDLEQVRQFLAVEEKIEFRCRGGGIAKPSEAAAAVAADGDVPPLPERKPSSATESAVAAGGSDAPLPDRKPASAEAKPSQTVADSDKTPPSKVKATR